LGRETNTELIAGYSYISNNLHGWYYTRPNKSKHLAEWFSFDVETVPDTSKSPFQYIFKYRLVKPKGCHIPVFPWAGGDELPKNNLHYDVNIKINKYIWQ